MTLTTQNAQTAFRCALLDPATPVPPGLTSWNGSDPVQRFAVYRNNVTCALIAALEVGFPTVRALVGEAFFRDMAREFARAEPPASPMLMDYGAGFPAFLAQFEPLAGLAYLPDLARLELARRGAFHAADADSLPSGLFAALGPDALADLRLRLHPSLEVLASSYAIHSLWAAHQGAIAIEDVDPDVAEDVLVLRLGFEVVTLRLPPGGAVFFTALRNGARLGEAVLEAAATPGFELSPCMSILVAQGATTAMIGGET